MVTTMTQHDGISQFSTQARTLGTLLIIAAALQACGPDTSEEGAPKAAIQPNQAVSSSILAPAEQLQPDPSPDFVPARDQPPCCQDSTHWAEIISRD